MMTRTEKVGNEHGDVTVTVEVGERLVTVRTVSENPAVLGETRSWRNNKAGRMLANHHTVTTLSVLRDHYGLAWRSGEESVRRG